MKTRGFTIVEVLVSMAIIAIVASLVVSPLAQYRDRTSLDADTDNVVTLLREARALTLASRDAAQYGVHFTDRSAVIFRGGAYTPEGEIGRMYELSVPISWGVLALAGGGSDVVFERLTGATAQFGTVPLVVTARAALERTINVDPSGLTRLP